jgi:stage V sporulation protein G
VEITEVRIKLMDDPNDRLQGFCSITFDGCFVVRDLKIIQGAKGAFVAMPSRKLTDRCGDCGAKNHLRAGYCNECGAELEQDRAVKDGDGRAKLYADIAHPINSRCRDMIQTSVLEAFEKEKVLAKQPNYVCTYDDYGEDRIATVKRSSSKQKDVGVEQTAETSSRTIRINGPDGQQRRIDIPAGETASRPHHLGTPDEAKESVGDSDESFGTGV